MITDWMREGDDLIYMIRDDVSVAGMRRVHVVGESGAEAEAAVVGLCGKEGAELALRLGWEDEVLTGQFHFYGAWRCMVGGYPMFAVGLRTGDGGRKTVEMSEMDRVVDAVWRGIRGYEERIGKGNGRWCVVARKGLVPDEVMRITGADGREVEVRRVEVETGWQAGILGVWTDESEEVNEN